MPLTNGELLDIITTLFTAQTAHIDQQNAALRAELTAKIDSVDKRVTALADEAKPAIDAATTIKTGSRAWVVLLAMAASLGSIIGFGPQVVGFFRGIFGK